MWVVATTELGYIVFYGQQKWSASSSWAVNQAETEMADKKRKWTRKKAEKGRQAMRKLKIDYNSIINIYQLWSTKTQSVVTLRVKVWQTIHAHLVAAWWASDFSGRSHYGQSWISGPSLKNKMGVSKNAGVVSIPQNIQFMFFNQKNHGKIGFFANGWVWVSSIFSPTFLDKPRSFGSDWSQPDHPVELPLGNQRRVRQLGSYVGKTF